MPGVSLLSGPQTRLTPVFLRCAYAPSIITKRAESLYNCGFVDGLALASWRGLNEVSGQRESLDNSSQDSNELHNSHIGNKKFKLNPRQGFFVKFMFSQDKLYLIIGDYGQSSAMH